MTARTGFGALFARVDREAARVAQIRPPLVAARDLFFDEIERSTALAGATLGPLEVRALVERDRVAGGRSLAENVLVADYAEAARFVRGTPLPRGRKLLAVDEIATLHALAVRRTLDARPGRWREGTAPPLPSGMVPPPAWLVPREVTAFVDRFAGGPAPETHRLLWIADAHERFLRLHPFDAGNGRLTRLVTNLLMRRVGLPPFVVRVRDGARYVAALRSADSRDAWPLAHVVGTSVLESFSALFAAADAADEELAPLGEIAAGAERAALYKAAQRGRLRTVRRGRALLTKQAWIDAYREQRPGAADSRRSRPL